MPVARVLETAYKVRQNRVTSFDKANIHFKEGIALVKSIK